MNYLTIVTSQNCAVCAKHRMLGNFRTGPIDPALKDLFERHPDRNYGWDANYFWKLSTATDKPVDANGSMLTETNQVVETEQPVSPRVFQVRELHMNGLQATSILDSDEFTLFDMVQIPEVHIVRTRYVRAPDGGVIRHQDDTTNSANFEVGVRERHAKFTELVQRYFPWTLMNLVQSYPTYVAIQADEWNRGLASRDYNCFGQVMNATVEAVGRGWKLGPVLTWVTPIPFVMGLHKHPELLDRPTSPEVEVKAPVQVEINKSVVQPTSGPARIPRRSTRIQDALSIEVQNRRYR